MFDRQGIVLSGVIGLADSGTRAPVTDGTLFRLGSVTKTVTAIAIMQLIEQGHFGLQTPVSELLPDAPIRNPFADSDPVRVIHLLTHTAGFDDMHAKAFFSPVERRGRHLESSLQHPEPLTVRWRPGMYESYSNPGYVLLVNSENGLRKLEEPLADFISHQTQWKPPAPALQPLTGDIDGWYRLVNPRISLLGLPTYLLSVGRAKAQADTLTLEPVLPGFGYQATLKHHGEGLLADVDYGEVINGVVVRNGDGAAVGLETGGDSLQRTSMVAAVFPLVSVLVSLTLLLSTPFGRCTSLRNRWVRRLPGLALLSLVLGIICAANLELTVLAHRNWQTVGVWAASVLFPALGVAGLILSVRTWRQEPAAVARWRCLLGSASVVCLSTWLATFGLFSFALWRW